MAVIRKKYLQVKLKKEDRDAFRYLWRDMDFGPPPRIMRIVTLLFGAKPCPFLAIATTRYHAEKNERKFPQSAQVAKDNAYAEVSWNPTYDKKINMKI